LYHQIDILLLRPTLSFYIFYNDYYDGFNTITVRANSNNIKKMINNLADRKMIYTRKINDGYIVEIEDAKSNNDMCHIDSDGIKRCYRVDDEGKCDVQIDSNGKISAHNKNCRCTLYRDEYHCYIKEDENDGVYE